MKKVLALMGSPRQGQTYRAVAMFETELKRHTEVEFSYLDLNTLNLESCKGCGVCLDKGENFCPHKDDQALLVAKLQEADGVLFATPNYSLQVSGLLKKALDRLAFLFHRPCLFHKTSMALVTQGVYGGKAIVKYLDNVAEFWGFNTCRGLVLNTPWGVVNHKKEWPPEEIAKIQLKLQKAAIRYAALLNRTEPIRPSMLRLLLFRLTRSAHKYSTEHKRDYAYFQEHDWFTLPYFYPVKLSWAQTLLGGLVDRWQASLAKKNSP